MRRGVILERTRTLIIIAFLILLPKIACAESWVLWQYDQIPTQQAWILVDGFEDLKTCKKGAENKIGQYARRMDEKPIELNAGWQIIRGTPGHEVIKFICVPGNIDPRK